MMLYFPIYRLLKSLDVLILVLLCHTDSVTGDRQIFKQAVLIAFNRKYEVLESEKQWPHHQNNGHII